MLGDDFLHERQLAILNMVANSPKINVSSLSKELGVSQVTIRQDLRTLENNGMLKRFHGGAMPVSDDDMMKRLSFNFEVKTAIAQEAASLVNNGETVLIESGSTNVLLAVELAKKSNITIITNSAFISRYISGMNNVKIILLGGDYQHESEVLVGPLTRKCLKEFHVDKVFIGVDGFSPNTGFTCVNLMRAEVAHAMAEQADKVIIVTDSSKFNMLGVASQLQAEDVDMVITDTNISAKDLDILKSFDIEVRSV
ncbi:MAG: DeoR family transcriptional regulator [Firmicutes bacterium HGW-Firmicutes-7]|nr:MAG: DeoR family transcriptional regulator [Firmicutes bacterium HGW-Firmicutes-7]